MRTLPAPPGSERPARKCRGGQSLILGRPRLPARLSPRRARLLALLGLLGPGLIAANAGNDAGGIATYSSVGAKYGYSLLWTIVLVTISLAIVQRHAVDPERIASITNETYKTVHSHFSNKDVRTVMGARVSVPYCIAAAAVAGSGITFQTMRSNVASLGPAVIEAAPAGAGTYRSNFR